MAHRRGGFRGRGISDSQRRKKAWFQLVTATGATGAGLSAISSAIATNLGATAGVLGGTNKSVFAAVSLGALTASGDELSTLPEESTILRIRGSLLFPKNVVGSGVDVVADNYSFGFGVTDIRSIVNATVPGPILDASWDGWMFLRQSGLPPVEANSGIVDVKAMRKLKTGDAFFVAMESVSGDTTITPAFDFLYDLRLLILLP